MPPTPFRPAAGRRRALIALAGLASALTLTAPAAAQPGGLTIEATTPWSLPAWPVPVQILAYSARATDLSVEVTCNTMTARATFALPAGARVRRTVLVPAGEPTSLGCAPRVRWQTSDGDAGVASGTIAQNQLDVALVAPHAAVIVDEEWRLADVTAANLPDRWQGYPLDATFVVGPEADAALTGPQRAALATWSRAGGQLLLLGLGDRASAWDALGAVPALVADDYQEALRSWLATPRESEPAPWSHRVPGTETVPVGGFLLVALAFAILAGPVNLWWVIKKRNQRGLFLLTTPLLSVVACAILIGYNLLSEGLGVRRAAVQLTWLDGARHTAIHVTGVTFFAGTGSDGFDVGPDVLVRPLAGSEPIPEDPADDANHPRETRWTETAQELRGEWIPTRVNRQLSFLSPEPERRRVTVNRAGAGYALVNGLEVRIDSVWWVDDAGQTWFASQIEAGHAGTLTRSPDGLPGGVPFGRLGPGSERLWQRAARPNHFGAELAQPLSPIPGPAASDEAPLQAWVAGPLTATTPTPPTPEVAP